MTAATRLWRRAPLWRLLLAATLAFGVLSALYPLPALHFPGWLRGAATPSRDASSGATATPIDPPQRGTLRIAGRIVPLPVGDWHELVAGRVEDAAEMTGLILGRWQGGVLTGFLTVLASTGPVGPNNFTNPASTCDKAGSTMVRWSDLGRTCWLVRARVMPPPQPPTVRPDTVEDIALQRVATLGVTIPTSLSTTVWSHADGHEILRYELSVANVHDRGGDAALAALGNWMGRFAPLLRRGYDDKLDPTAVAAVARDPGFKRAGSG